MSDLKPLTPLIPKVRKVNKNSRRAERMVLIREWLAVNGPSRLGPISKGTDLPRAVVSRVLNDYSYNPRVFDRTDTYPAVWSVNSAAQKTIPEKVEVTVKRWVAGPKPWWADVD